MKRLTYINGRIKDEFTIKVYEERRCQVQRPVIEDLLRLYTKYGESVFKDEFGRNLLEEV